MLSSAPWCRAPSIPVQSRFATEATVGYRRRMSHAQARGSMQNADAATVQSFGDEWSRFTFESQDGAELDTVFSEYFSEFPWADLAPGAQGFDAGCGTGRWAERVAARVGRLHCVDASPQALAVARHKLRARTNCEFHECDLGTMPFEEGSMDFGYSLGVLHHLPDPALGLKSCVRKLKPGAPFLVYFYYALENRPWRLRAAWRMTDVLRRAIARLPNALRYGATQGIATTVYLPLARLSWLLERFDLDVKNLPLSDYRHRSFYVMRNDALDRFGTPVEHRWSRSRLQQEMERAGLGQIRFREGPPYWCAVGWRVD